MIDSEQVPWGKGEKHPDKGDEIVSETICLQEVRGEIKFILFSLMAFLLKNEPTSALYVA